MTKAGHLKVALERLSQRKTRKKTWLGLKIILARIVFGAWHLYFIYLYRGQTDTAIKIVHEWQLSKVAATVANFLRRKQLSA